MPALSEFEAFTDAGVDPPVQGFLHNPQTPSGDGLVLTHGAGANCASALLVQIATAFANRGMTVLRVDLSFRQLRRYGPPHPGQAARDREGLKRAIAVLRDRCKGGIFLGGHSYGGRQATMLCAESPGLVDGLLLLSYPLHPPRKPEQLRVQHLPNLRTPCVFVHGTRDPFGTVQEMESALKLIPAKCELIIVEGAGHDLGKSLQPEEIAAHFLAWMAAEGPS